MGDEDLVRLNVEVPRDLWRLAKIRAVQANQDLRDVVIQALRDMLLNRPFEAAVKEYELLYAAVKGAASQNPRLKHELRKLENAGDQSTKGLVRDLQRAARKKGSRR